MKKLRLDNYGLEKTETSNTLYGEINGERLYFKVPANQELKLCANPFVLAMLLPAMEAGLPIELPAELKSSEEFLRNLDCVQDIFSSWYPQLSKIAIEVEIDHQDLVVQQHGKALFFSGGIDACYSLLKYRSEVTHLIYVRGIDMQLDDDKLWAQCLQSNQKTAELFDKTLIAIESNIRFVIRNISNPEIGWTMAQGCGLASIAHVLGYACTIISASNTFRNLHPLGSHPLTDPLFSSRSSKISHLGCEASRHEKLMEISKEKHLLRNLRVCWQGNEVNCGKCDKCLHLRMALYLLELEAGGLAPLTDLKNLASAHTGTLGEYIEWEDNLILAEKVGNLKAIKALKRILNRYKRKEMLKLADDAFLNGKLMQLKRRLK